MNTKSDHYDVIVIGSGFGGSVAALRATEKGYKVGVLESGRRWSDEDIPKTSWDVRKFAWQPGAEMYLLLNLLGGKYPRLKHLPRQEHNDDVEWQ